VESGTRGNILTTVFDEITSLAGFGLAARHIRPQTGQIAPTAAGIIAGPLAAGQAD
jgi:hypothetical protein